MPAMAPGDAKNTIRRVFAELADPSPSQAEQLRLRKYFGHQCAYCGVQLEFNAKEAHIDHLVAASKGGSNAIGNRVLSCAPCNAEGKREKPWEVFLAGKDLPADVLEVRRQRIVDWQQVNPLPTGEAVLQIREFARERAAEVVSAFESAVAELKEKKKVLMTRGDSHADAG